MKDFIIFEKGWVHGYIEDGIMSEMGNYWGDDVWDAMRTSDWCVIYEILPGKLVAKERYRGESV